MAKTSPFDARSTSFAASKGAEFPRREQAEWAVQVAGLDTDLTSFPKGLDTVVGERGITLSGGQKQRTAIARAVLRNPRLLILDDALASVDTVTEEKILKALAGVMRGRTNILISHRVSTVRNADRIIVLDHGRVVEQGTHDELLGLGRLLCGLASETNTGAGIGGNLINLASF